VVVTVMVVALRAGGIATRKAAVSRTTPIAGEVRRAVDEDFLQNLLVIASCPF
jgi:hypothetical protein